MYLFPKSVSLKCIKVLKNAVGQSELYLIDTDNEYEKNTQIGSG